MQEYQAASARYIALREPDAAVCHNLAFSAEGAIVDATSPDWVADELFAGVAANPPTDWTKIRRRGWACFPVHCRGEAGLVLLPGSGAAGRVRRRLAADHGLGQPTVDKFAEGNETNTYRLWGAPHYVYISDEAEVVRWMRDFFGEGVSG